MKHAGRSFFFLLLLSFFSCQAAPKELSPKSIPMDIHSHAEPNKVRVTHVSLDLTLDFEKKQIRGMAMLEFWREDFQAPLVLDVHGPVIEKILGADGSPRKFELGPADPILGSALTIPLAARDRKLAIFYRTSEKADALQWLAPEQTAGGKREFLLTQGQSILTRSWIPLQDTPGVRVTYDAAVRAPKGLTTLMSAERLGQSADGVTRFKMRQAIPPYLIALACGDLVFRPISKRCGIWAEPPLADGAAAEFSDMEAMVQAAEKLYGFYRWGRYDVLFLPPSFPFGGMENPMLTFATPTVLAGDKSLVSLVAHELAHSWSGNLVTNATWSDFWLNEGFTVYFENRIMEAVYGKERAAMEMALEREALEKEMAGQQPWEQVLRVDLRGKHPDDGFSQIPYVKGALFLHRLEQLFGREAFDRFLSEYFESHAFTSIETEEFLGDLREKLFSQDEKKAAQVDLKKWIDEPGLPEDAPKIESQKLAQADRAREEFLTGKSCAELPTKDWATQQWVAFLERMPSDLGAELMGRLDSAFQFTKSRNAEILTVWLRLAIQNGYTTADAKLEEFLMNVGRRKFLKPLYTEFAKTPQGLERARAIYEKARPRYHAVSTGTIDKILGKLPRQG